MTLLFFLIAFYIAWIWVDYFRLIDVFQANNFVQVIGVFLMGCTSVLFVFGMHAYFPSFFFIQKNGEYLNDFLYFTINVGVVEEVAKMLPFLIFYLFRRKEFKEPIDYLAFISVSALGFSTIENVMYFSNYGHSIISSRAILCAVGHMFDTALIAYGIVLYKYHPKYKSPLIILGMFALAFLSHGIYDFSLSVPNGWILTFVFFLITMSLFATIMNNALNNSSYFTYKKTINPMAVTKKLLIYYGVLLGIQLLLSIVFTGIAEGIVDSLVSYLVTGFIIVVTCARLSRFKLIKGRWFKLKLELPISFNFGADNSRFFRLSLKGDGQDEAMVTPYYQDYCYVYPVTEQKSIIRTPKLAYVDEIRFLKYDEVFYLIKIFKGGFNSDYDVYIVKPKSLGENYVNGKYPILGMFDKSGLSQWNNSNLDVRDFQFIEWVFLRPFDKS